MTFDENNDEHLAYRLAILAINPQIEIVDMCDDGDSIDYVSCRLDDMTFDLHIDQAILDKYFDTLT